MDGLGIFGKSALTVVIVVFVALWVVPITFFARGGTLEQAEAYLARWSSAPEVLSGPGASQFEVTEARWLRDGATFYAVVDLTPLTPTAEALGTAAGLIRADAIGLASGFCREVLARRIGATLAVPSDVQPYRVDVQMLASDEMMTAGATPAREMMVRPVVVPVVDGACAPGSKGEPGMPVYGGTLDGWRFGAVADVDLQDGTLRTVSFASPFKSDLRVGDLDLLAACQTVVRDPSWGPFANWPDLTPLDQVNQNAVMITVLAKDEDGNTERDRMVFEVEDGTCLAPLQ